jgi:hypothetical protein
MKYAKVKHLFLLHIILFFALSYSVGFSEASTGSALKVGDFVELGQYENEPVVWQVVSIDADGNPLLFSRRILTIKAFDACGSQYEEDGYYSFEKHYGSNRWETSTLRKWLNSDDKLVNWSFNAPDAENVFNGEKPYNTEAGFLHSSNFNAREKAMIKETTYTTDDGAQLNDKVILLSTEEAMSYSVCSRCYPLQHLKHQAISKPYDIWTRDAVKDTLHAVKTLKWDGNQSRNVANVSRSGVAPALKLDSEKIGSMKMMGNGISYKPYYFELGSATNYVVIICLVVTGILIVWILYKLLRSARIQAAVMLIGILCVTMLLTACLGISIRSSAAIDKKPDDHYEDYLIVLQYALDMDLIEKRIGELFQGESVLVVAQDGNDMTENILTNFSEPKSPAEMSVITNEIFKNDWRVVRGGDYRVTTIKREIDDVFADKSTVYPVLLNGDPESNDKTELFKQAVSSLYAAQKYEAIADYLRLNELQIVHPLDWSAVGIGELYVFD